LKPIDALRATYRTLVNKKIRAKISDARNNIKSARAHAEAGIRSKEEYKTRMKMLAEYHSKDPVRPFVEISPEMQKYYAELRENGVVKIPNMFAALSDYINTDYIEAYEKTPSSVKHWVKSAQNERTKAMGMTVNLSTSYSDINLQDYYFNSGLLGIVYNYFQRQPYHRNLPVLMKSEFKNEQNLENAQVDYQGKYHVDAGLHQISFMLLTSDLTIDDTHMQYALKSNNVTLPENIYRFSYDDSEIEKKYEIYDLVGEKGTLFIFDAGNGYHRALYKSGTVRKVLHLNFTTGHSLIGEFEYEGANFDFLKNKKDYVAESIKKLIKEAPKNKSAQVAGSVPA
jgi:hypothetical protein